jgi:hypothetical protein
MNCLHTLEVLRGLAVSQFVLFVTPTPSVDTGQLLTRHISQFSE